MKENRKKTHLNPQVIAKLIAKKSAVAASKPASMRPMKSVSRAKSIKRLAVVPK